MSIIDKICAPKYRFARNLIHISFEILSVIGVFLLLFAPFCETTVKKEPYTIDPIGVFKALEADDLIVSSFVPLQLGILIALIAMLVLLFFKMIQTVLFLSNEDEVMAQSKNTLLLSSATVAIYTVFAFAFSPINKILLAGDSSSKVSYTPVIFIAVIIILYAILVGIINVHKRRLEESEDTFDQRIKKERKKQRRTLFWKELELLVFAVALAFITVLSLMSDIIRVVFSVPKVRIPDFVITGKKLIFRPALLETTGERTLAFFAFGLFFLTVACLLLAAVAFCSRSEQFGKMALGSVTVSSVSCLLVGMFGQYYHVVQALNADIVLHLLDQFNIQAEEILQYKISSRSMLYAYLALVILAALFIRHPYSHIKRISGQLYATNTTVLTAAPNVHISGGGGGMGGGAAAAAAPQKGDHDPCPTFTAIDAKEEEFRKALAEKQTRLMQDPSLPNLVSFIVQYARDSRLHLFYTAETVAGFLAGLGTTRLAILQGMSGTGKTSLPKIFTEALSSVCDIVEVESSWRDKNELLGYYNEFSKVYSPKKFTQALYRASLNPEVITFIVLDEMNLSRIEYYFSDFLSLMENEPDRRAITLLNTSIRRSENGMPVDYKSLTEGNTLPIPANVWFIGTANRDESTYDISDKVYDRAYTMNFDKRAAKPSVYGDPIPAKYLPADALLRLFREATEAVRFNVDQNPVIEKVEELLKPYNISFGNRIAVQMESFIGIYASCFHGSEEKIREALDIILLSKVVKKLELKSVDNKEELAEEFEKLGLFGCCSFILSLKED
ncbi:MAG: hypothetical protein IJW99_03465 [Clostridia bacterium]|nr:hypothetical protein [Clostridia bacterium]